MATVKKIKKAQAGTTVTPKYDRSEALKAMNSVKSTPASAAADKAKQDSAQKANRPTWLGGVHSAGYRAENEKQKNGGKTPKAKAGAKVMKKAPMKAPMGAQPMMKKGGKMKKGC